MTKRKAEDAVQPASTPCPAQRNAYVQPAIRRPLVLHCQPTNDVAQFETCMLARCNHCAGCLECHTRRQLTWQNDHHLRAMLSLRNPGLRQQAEVYDRIAPSFTRDHEAHDQIFMLQDQLHALQQQMNQMQQALRNNTPAEHFANDNAGLHVDTNDEGGLDGGVRKYESSVEHKPNLNDFDPSLPGDNAEAAPEADDDQYDTARSTCDDGENEITLKREGTPADQFVLIDQIPSSGRYQRRQPMVVIDAEEQREARRSLEKVQQCATREQPLRETTLRTPRASIEDTRHNAAGSAWTEKEDQRLLEGFKRQLSCKEIHHKYLPNRTAEAIKKRRQKLTKR